MASRVPITPDTKVGTLLDAYPELEEVLIDLAPVFVKLRNPVLRRTIARVTTLATAAKVGNVQIRDLVRALRAAAGQGVDDNELPLAGNEEDVAGVDPDWVSDGQVVNTIEADDVLASDSTPLQLVMSRAARLGRGEMLCVRSSFRPEPLVEALQNKGHAVHCRGNEIVGFETFIKGK